MLISSVSHFNRILISGMLRAGHEEGGAGWKECCLFVVCKKSRMPPVEEKKIYELLLSGCYSPHRPALSIIFWKMFHRHFTRVSPQIHGDAILRRGSWTAFSSWLASFSCAHCGGGEEARRLKFNKMKRGKSSAFTPFPGCFLGSSCVWGTAFASAGWAAGTGKEGMSLLKQQNDWYNMKGVAIKVINFLLNRHGGERDLSIQSIMHLIKWSSANVSSSIKAEFFSSLPVWSICVCELT